MGSNANIPDKKSVKGWLNRLKEDGIQRKKVVNRNR
jgi:hypothetical protein